MQYPRLLLPLLLMLAACGEDQPPTAPVGPSGPAFSHTATHKVVNSLADPGNGTCNATQCTLREAINAPGSTEISFAPGLTGPITLASPTAGGGTLGIDKNLTITGPSATIVIQRRTTDPEFRIFRVGAATVTLRNLTIRDGRSDRGGGIRNAGTLRLINSTVTANFGGSSIINFGTLRLSNSTITGNSGGIANQNNATLALTNSRVTRNSGVGIFDNGGTLAVDNSTIANNSNHGIVTVRGTATLDRATITGNESGGIEAGKASVTLTNSTVAGNKNGGGIANFGGTFTISKSTISNNSADGGGGVYSEADDAFCRISALVTITNSTISGNTARFGGGIANRGCGLTPDIHVTNSTVVRNFATETGGGIYDQSDEGHTSVTNSIVAQNSAPTGPQVFGNVGGSSNLIGGDPKIDALANNGGPTRTHALRAGSPAIDAASSSECQPTDQRGVPRPQGAACDIGSYERQ